MATGISITPPSALTIGTTAISNGVEGRVLFQGAGDVLQQDAELFWDNVNKRLGVGATPDVNTRLDIRAQGALSTDLAFRVRNSANTADLVSMLGNGDVIVGSQTGGTPSNAKALRIDSPGFSKLHFNTSYNAPSTPTAEITINRRQATFVDDNVWMFQQRNFSDGNNKSYKTYYINPSSYYGAAASIANEGYVAGWSWFANSRTDANRLMKLSVDGALNLYNRPTLPIETNFVDSFQMYSANRGGIDGKASAHFRAEDGTINVIGDFSGFGTDNPQARLDVRAQGALSTDIAFRVRNSADTLDTLRITGNNRIELGNTTNIIGGGAGSSFITNISIGGSVRLDAPFNFNSQEVFNGQRLHFATTYETNGTRLIQMQNGTAPTTGLADAFKMYSADITAGNAAPHFRTENGDIIKLFKTVLPSLSTTVINTGDAATDTLLSELFDALKSVGLIAE
jgi:hypothetical protein